MFNYLGKTTKLTAIVDTGCMSDYFTNSSSNICKNLTEYDGVHVTLFNGSIINKINSNINIWTLFRRSMANNLFSTISTEIYYQWDNSETMIK